MHKALKKEEKARSLSLSGLLRIPVEPEHWQKVLLAPSWLTCQAILGFCRRLIVGTSRLIRHRNGVDKAVSGTRTDCDSFNLAAGAVLGSAE